MHCNLQVVLKKKTRLKIVKKSIEKEWRKSGFQNPDPQGKTKAKTGINPFKIFVIFYIPTPISTRFSHACCIVVSVPICSILRWLTFSFNSKNICRSLLILKKKAIKTEKIEKQVDRRRLRGGFEARERKCCSKMFQRVLSCEPCGRYGGLIFL